MEMLLLDLSFPHDSSPAKSLFIAALESFKNSIGNSDNKFGSGSLRSLRNQALAFVGCKLKATNNSISLTTKNRRPLRLPYKSQISTILES